MTIAALRDTITAAGGTPTQYAESTLWRELITALGGTPTQYERIGLIREAITAAGGTPTQYAYVPLLREFLTTLGETPTSYIADELEAQLATATFSSPTLWNTADKSGMALTNGDLTATVSGGAPGGVRSTNPLTGKVYAEFLAVSAPGDPMLGITQGDTSLSAWLYNGAGTKSVVWYATAATVYFGAGGGSSPSGISNAATNDILQIAVDVPNDRIWFGNDNSWSGDPAAGTGSFSLAGLTGDIFFAFQGAGTEAITANFGATAFAYTPPAGFSGLG